MVTRRRADVHRDRALPASSEPVIIEAGAEGGRAFPRRALAIALGASALGWCLLLTSTIRHPWVGLGNWGSDHFSHVFSTVLFMERGMEIYRRPIHELCARPAANDPALLAAAQRYRATPGDLCWLDEDRRRAPLVINWAAFPRPYPPGQLLYFLPEALLFRYGGVAFEALNAVAICKLVAMAHLCLWLLALLVQGLRPPALTWLALGLAYWLLVPWAMAGIYDGVAIAALLGTVLLLQRGQSWFALAAGACAFALHFRSLWYAPLLGYTAARALRSLRGEADGRWGWPAELRGRPWSSALVLGSLALAALALHAFVELLPWLGRFPVNNPLIHSALGPHKGDLWRLVLSTALVVAVLAWRRHGLLLAVVLCTTWALTRAPQNMPWHATFLVPALAVALVGRALPDARERAGERLGVALAWSLLVVSVAFSSPLQGSALDGTWVTYVVERIRGG